MRSVLAIPLVLLATLIASALPAAAQEFGSLVARDAGTFDSCMDGAFPDSSKESFACEGKARGTAGCTNQRTSEVSPRCVYSGHEPATDRDTYLCAPARGPLAP